LIADTDTAAVTGVMDEGQLAAAAVEVTVEWMNLAEQAAALKNESEASPGVRAGLVDGFLTCDRSLIMFLCGGQDGRRDRRDIQPKDLLGREWWPEDEEMDQRLRGRLAVMARFNAHMSWERVLNKDAVRWPYNLLAWETTWSMGCFVRQLEQVRAAAVPAFQEAERRVHELLGPREPWPISTNEYAVPRSGQIDRRRANGAPNPKRSRPNAE